MDKEQEQVELWTDGSSLLKTQEGGWAFYVVYRGKTAIRYGYASDTTNNAMEIEAILRGLQYIPLASYPLVIKSDSQYAIKAISEWVHGWKSSGWLTSQGQPVKNRELIEEANNYLAKHLVHRKVKFIKVKGHSGIIENELCDQKAGIARIEKITNWSNEDHNTTLTKQRR